MIAALADGEETPSPPRNASRLTTRAIEQFLIILQFAVERHDDFLHPCWHATIWGALQLLLPLLIGETLLT